MVPRESSALGVVEFIHHCLVPYGDIGGHNIRPPHPLIRWTLGPWSSQVDVANVASLTSGRDLTDAATSEDDTRHARGADGQGKQRLVALPGGSHLEILLRPRSTSGTSLTQYSCSVSRETPGLNDVPIRQDTRRQPQRGCSGREWCRVSRETKAPAVERSPT